MITKLTTAKTSLEKEVQDIVNEEAEGDVDRYIESLRRSGCVSGMVGRLVYYSDTNDFYERHEDEIWEMIVNMQKDLGYKDPFSVIAMFNGAVDVGSAVTFKNLLAWVAFEETAFKLYDRELEKRKTLTPHRQNQNQKMRRHP